MKENFSPSRSPYDSDYLHDELGLLIYWSEGYKFLYPAKPIEDGQLFISKTGQQNLLPQHLSLKPGDQKIFNIYSFNNELLGAVCPGISASLYFGTPQSNQGDIRTSYLNQIGRIPHSKNRIHITQIQDIYNASWIPFYAPAISCAEKRANPLHVILCPKSVLESDQIIDATLEEKQRLAEVFVRL
ncbi:MAG: hypothetical protein Q8P53_03360 [Candidatus Shapirobacteria bacterium]|nr:hypothetical protein [Candidatus Shapirobacteria bacterium]